MNPIENEIDKISEAVLEMIELVRLQLERSKEAFINADKELADQIIYTETRVNSLELSIDRNCEHAIARFSPVATDLRFMVSMLKINSDLERIGDYADGIAEYVDQLDKPISKKFLDEIQVPEMFDLAIGMVQSIGEYYANDDIKSMKKLFKRDKQLNKINRQKSEVIGDYIKDKPAEIQNGLLAHSVIKKLERVGDHVKNIAEDYIFYSEAKVLKHKK